MERIATAAGCSDAAAEGALERVLCVFSRLRVCKEREKKQSNKEGTASISEFAVEG